MFPDRGMVEIDGVAGVPLAISFVEFSLHEMAGDWGECHLELLILNGIIELEDPVESRPSISNPQPAAGWVLREYSRHRLSHWRLLRHVQRPHCTCLVECNALASLLFWDFPAFILDIIYLRYNY